MGAFIEAPYHSRVSLQGIYFWRLTKLTTVDLIECPTPARDCVVSGVAIQSVSRRDDDALACEERQFVALPVGGTCGARAARIEAGEHALRLEIRPQLCVPANLLRD